MADVVLQRPDLAPLDEASVREAKAQSEHLETLYLVVANASCPSCIEKIEASVAALPGVSAARLNYSTRRLSVARKLNSCSLEDIQACLDAQGYRAAPFDPARQVQLDEREAKDLLWRLAIAGFAAANVMLLSVSVWSGLASDMGTATRSLFHWLSALIAVPAVLYAGVPFFRSAVAAVKKRQLNMDVPIALAVTLSCGISFYRTIAGEALIYFDAALMLLFFLLIGRYLDRQMRRRATTTAQNLLALRASSAVVVETDGQRRNCPIQELKPGMKVVVASGECIPVDGDLAAGFAEVDMSLITGESAPQITKAGDEVFAGTLNLGGPIEVLVRASDEDTLLGEIIRLMELAEQRRGRYVVMADRLAGYYAPLVHILALATLIGWWALSQSGFEAALMNAVAVLIITCPCALGLAVPIVQVIAVGRLLRRGILTKSGDGLERLAKVDTVVFDKTGTLSLSRPRLLNAEEIDPASFTLAAALAGHSRHPLSRVLAEARPSSTKELSNLQEVPGAGLTANYLGEDIRLGHPTWCAVPRPLRDAGDHAGPELWFRWGQRDPVRFLFEEDFRADAIEVIEALKSMGLQVELLSGDRESAVRRAANRLGIDSWRAGQRPNEKVSFIASLRNRRHRVLMVGDGLNDAAALTEANASISPASAIDVSQTMADFVFQGDNLSPILETLRTARRAQSLVVQNFVLAFLYNAIAVPLAICGLVTPLIAAIAMSSSSLLVSLNSLRLNRRRREKAVYAWR
ncbi:MAG: heavy metal translocating P-type ATPase [Pseudomonadota bacterium]